MRAASDGWCRPGRTATRNFRRWVTDSRWERAQAALKQTWTVGEMFTGNVPAFAAGTFSDEELPVAEAVEEASPFADEDEEELAVAAAPVKRGPGRPKKS